MLNLSNSMQSRRVVIGGYRTYTNHVVINIIFIQRDGTTPLEFIVDVLYQQRLYNLHRELC